MTRRSSRAPAAGRREGNDGEAPGAPGGAAGLAVPGGAAPVPALLRHSPFAFGFFAGLGALLAWWLGSQVLRISGVLVLIVVAMFLAAGLNPVVEFLQRRGIRRGYALLTVIVGVLIGLTLFGIAIVPVISDQIAALTDQAPGWFDRLQNNRQVQDLDNKYHIVDKAKDYVSSGDYASSVFGGVVGVGLAVVSALANAFIVTVLTLYFLSSLEATKTAFYRLAPATRRERVRELGDRVIESVGGYVSGAFVVATCAGLSSLVFLFAIGLGQYAVALAFVVALLDIIPMIGATLGAVVVSAIAFAEDPKMGLFCVIFYVIYQQVENYVIYPRVMSRSVDVPGAVTVIAALVGAALLGVVGALLAIPTAAAILMLTREIVVKKQDDR
ncbi:AI-2E family transporter [Nocardioides taihuensis]|uniref:AI-2E family transporter n=1 Tax=Nocardioides taihuensis TaxID=1835606 RepID=A0ABW0BMC2_9ACTN